jgi:uncharacterized protein
MSKTLYFNITYSCNSFCVFCAANFYGSSVESRPQLDISDFKNILKQSDIQQGDNVIINGGEPTVHKDFFKFLSVVKEMGGYPILFTNGIKLNNKDFTAQLAEFEPMQIRIPFFGSDSEKHDSLTGRKGNFEKTLQGFSNIIELKEQGVNFDIDAKLLLSKATYQENPRIANFLMSKFPRLFYFSLNPLLIYKKVKENKDLLVESFSIMKPEIERTINLIIAKSFTVSLDLVPLCILDTKYAGLFPPIRHKPEENFYFDPNFTDRNFECPEAKKLSSRKCTPCLYKHTCHGFYPEYLDIFGLSEIKPIVEKLEDTTNKEHFVINMKDSVILDLKTSHCITKDSYCILTDPKTASWAVIKNKNLNLYHMLREGKPLQTVKERFCNDFALADNLDELFYSGLLRLNGKSIVPPDIFEKNCIEPVIAPRYLVIKYTRRCNLNCEYCYAHSDYVNVMDMSNETLLKIIKSVYESFGDKELTVLFHGGEPLLRFNDIRSVIKDARKITDNISFIIQSNGTLITREMAKFFKDENISVGVSIDGYNFETNELRKYHNGKNSLIDSLKGIEALYSEGVRTGLISVITKMNYKKQREMVDFCAKHGLFSFVFNDFFPAGRGADKQIDLFVPVEEMFTTKRELFLTINDYNDDKNDKEMIRERNICDLVKHLTSWERDYMCSESPCGAVRQTLGFDCDGTIYPCDNFISIKDFSLGNIHTINNLRDHLEKNEIVKKILNHNILNIEKCSVCEWRWICNSHCAADSYHHTGRLNSHNPKCSYYKKIIPEIIDLLYSKRIDHLNFV